MPAGGQRLTSLSDLLKCFITKELMRWPGIESLYGPTLRQSPVFAPGSTLGKKTGARAEEKKPEELANPGEARWEELHKRVIEHVSVRGDAQCKTTGQTVHTVHTVHPPSVCRPHCRNRL